MTVNKTKIVKILYNHSRKKYNVISYFIDLTIERIKKMF